MKRISAFLILILLIFSCGTSENEMGQSYNSLTQLQSKEKAAGFLQIGVFGDYWPGTVVEVIEGVTEIEFTLKEGAKQKYPDYFGYNLKAVRLNSDNGEETVVVFRSE